MPEPTNRRGFLRELVRSAGEAIAEVAGGVGAEQSEAEPSAPSAAAAEPGPPPPLTPATPVASTMSIAELLRLADEEGLAHRRDALRRLALPSTRLTPAGDAAGTRSRIGRAPATAQRDGTVATVAEIDLADPALPAGVLPPAGRLVVQVIVPRRAPLAPCNRAQVRLEPVSEAAGELAEAAAVELSTELMLPRVWAAPVRDLGLVESEQAAYIRLRERVAERQGVTAEDGDAEGVARHHLFGYPTETTGTMPLMCELASRGLDPATSPVAAPQDAVDASERWQLLLQLTQDEPGGVVLGAGAERLYLWIARDALERDDLSEVWAAAR